MNNANWNNGDYDYRAIDFLYHSGVLVYSVVTIAPAYKLLSLLGGKQSWGHSLFPVLVIFSLMASLIPLSFFRGVRRGELFLRSFARFAVVPHVSPSWLHGGVFSTIRAVTLPFFLILPFLIAFPASCSYPVERLVVFLLTPPLLFLLAALVGVLFALRHFYVGKNPVLKSENSGPSSYKHACNEGSRRALISKLAADVAFLSNRTSGAVSLVLPLIFFVPLFFHESLIFSLLSWEYCQPAAVYGDKIFTFLAENWFVTLALLAGLYCVLMIRLKRFCFENQSMRFNHELKQTCGYSKFREMLAAFIFPEWFGGDQEHDRDFAAGKKILWGGFFVVSLEILFLLPTPAEPWDRMFYNLGIFMTLSIPVACYAWPEWEMAFGYDFGRVIKKSSLTVVVSLFAAVLIMAWKHTFAGPAEFVVYALGHFLVFGAVVSAIQMLHPKVSINMDSPGGGALTEPCLDGFVLFLIESSFVLVGASWATGVYLQHGGTIAHKVGVVWLMVNVLNGAGIVFFFILLPLWVCFNRMSSKSLNGQAFLKK